jgi:hypothetical protein
MLACKWLQPDQAQQRQRVDFSFWLVISIARGRSNSAHWFWLAISIARGRSSNPVDTEFHEVSWS